MISKNILITGASGYVGTRLANQLIKNKFRNIINYDISLYGDDHLPKFKNHIYIKKDLRDIDAFSSVIQKYSIDTVLHLACISNDPTFELKNGISKQINYDCFEDLVRISKQGNVKKFIYASTCSVYGISDSPNVTEDHPLLPITDYNKYKALCEPVLKKYLDDTFSGIIIRPATVCGFSEKMRFDLTVNILTNYAFNKGFIKVFGGEQTRPNIHIEDMCRLYTMLMDRDIKSFNGEVFNAGVENLKIIQIAEIIKKIFKQRNKDIDIQIEKSDDKRSYMINSDKIKKVLGFEFRFSVEDAVKDLLARFESNDLKDTFDSKWQNIQVLKNNLNLLADYSK
jgi:nucleoside-diphosphate-sugar epimerase